MGGESEDIYQTPLMDPQGASSGVTPPTTAMKRSDTGGNLAASASGKGVSRQ